MNLPRLCGAAGCDRPVRRNGLCDRDSNRMRRLGTATINRPTFEERFWAKVDRRGPDECWLWTATTNEHGYGVMRPDTVRRDGPTVKAHRVSARLAGMQIDGLKVLHACDNPICVNPGHLRPGTMAENSHDMVERGRSCRGEKQPRSKLAEVDVIEIRRRLSLGELHRDIAADFGVSRSTISNINIRATWRHLPDAVTPCAARDLGAAVIEAITGIELELAA